MVVHVEAAVLDDPLLTSNPGFDDIRDKLMTFREGKDDLTDKIDFIICLGGDGTLLYASSLFQQSVPPVMAFHLGSLGFLTPFEVDNFEQQITHVLEGHAALTLRSRLRCIVMKKESPSSLSSSSSNGGGGGDDAAAGNRQLVTPSTNLLVLNEVIKIPNKRGQCKWAGDGYEGWDFPQVVIDRGPSPYLSNIDLYLDGKLITSVQGDGLIISTPTGGWVQLIVAVYVIKSGFELPSVWRKKERCRLIWPSGSMHHL